MQKSKKMAVLQMISGGDIFNLIVLLNNLNSIVEIWSKILINKNLITIMIDRQIDRQIDSFGNF